MGAVRVVSQEPPAGVQADHVRRPDAPTLSPAGRPFSRGGGRHRHSLHECPTLHRCRCSRAGSRVGRSAYPCGSQTSWRCRRHRREATCFAECGRSFPSPAVCFRLWHWAAAPTVPAPNRQPGAGRSHQPACAADRDLRRRLRIRPAARNGASRHDQPFRSAQNLTTSAASSSRSGPHGQQPAVPLRRAPARSRVSGGSIVISPALQQHRHASGPRRSTAPSSSLTHSTSTPYRPGATAPCPRAGARAAAAPDARAGAGPRGRPGPPPAPPSSSTRREIPAAAARRAPTANAASGSDRSVQALSTGSAALQLVPSSSISVTCSTCRGPRPRSRRRTAVRAGDRLLPGPDPVRDHERGGVVRRTPPARVHRQREVEDRPAGGSGRCPRGRARGAPRRRSG